jgi:hypothetical protein
MPRTFLNPPTDLDLQLWKYLTFEKFESLITKSALWFSRADRFIDKLEGSYGLGNNDTIYDQLYSPKNYIPEEVRHARTVVRATIQLFRKETYITCWHINTTESREMWNEYTNGQGVCILSSYRSLNDEVKKFCPHIDVGFVKYIDHDKDFIDEFDSIAPFFFKNHRLFAHENELRAVWSQPNIIPIKSSRKLGDGMPVGVLVKVDLNTLVHSVIVHPNADHEFTEKINALCDYAKIEACKVVRSALEN